MIPSCNINDSHRTIKELLWLLPPPCRIDRNRDQVVSVPFFFATSLLPFQTTTVRQVEDVYKLSVIDVDDDEMCQPVCVTETRIFVNHVSTQRDYDHSNPGLVDKLKPFTRLI